MTECPCCSHPMIRRFRQKLVYWFCRHCWQAMPEGNFNISLSSRSVGLVMASTELPEEHSSLIPIQSVSLVTGSEEISKKYSSLPSTPMNLATKPGIRKHIFSLSIYDYTPT